MNTISLFPEHFQENPFHYQKFGLRELRIVRGCRAIVSLETTNVCIAYVTTMKAMSFNEEIPALPNHQLQKYYIDGIQKWYSISLHFKTLEKIFLILNSAVKVFDWKCFSIVRLEM